jgi:drug/metabolite transporter (DMT)-like permease
MSTLVIALLSIALSVAAQFSLKAGMSGVKVQEILAAGFSIRTLPAVLTDKFVMGGFLLYALGAIVWLAVLSKWDVSKAYPLVGIGFIASVVVGALMGEQMSSLRVGGAVLICAGVALVARS